MVGAYSSYSSSELRSSVPNDISVPSLLPLLSLLFFRDPRSCGSMHKGECVYVRRFVSSYSCIYGCNLWRAACGASPPIRHRQADALAHSTLRSRMPRLRERLFQRWSLFVPLRWPFTLSRRPLCALILPCHRRSVPLWSRTRRLKLVVFPPHLCLLSADGQMCTSGASARSVGNVGGRTGRVRNTCLTLASDLASGSARN